MAEKIKSVLYILGTLLFIYSILNVIASFISDEIGLFKYIAYCCLPIIGYILIRYNTNTYSEKLNKKTIIYLLKIKPYVIFFIILLIILFIFPIKYMIDETNFNDDITDTIHETYLKNQTYENYIIYLEAQNKYDIIFFSKLIVMFIATTLIFGYLYFYEKIKNYCINTLEIIEIRKK